VRRSRSPFTVRSWRLSNVWGVASDGTHGTHGMPRQPRGCQTALAFHFSLFTWVPLGLRRVKPAVDRQGQAVKHPGGIAEKKTDHARDIFAFGKSAQGDTG
jgi:hypothetical protein